MDDQTPGPLPATLIVDVAMADTTGTNARHISPVVINIGPGFIKRDPTGATDRHSFDGDAKALAMALWHALPGGTLDRLIVELLARFACQLRVPRPLRSDCEEPS